MIRIALVSGIVEYLDASLDVACAPVVVVRMAKEAGFLQVDGFEFGVSLDVVVVGAWVVLAQLHAEEGSALGQVFLFRLYWSVYLLKNLKQK